MRKVLDPFLVSFRYLLHDLGVQSAADLRGRPEASPMARLTLWLLQRARASDDLFAHLGPRRRIAGYSYRVEFLELGQTDLPPAVPRGVDNDTTLLSK